MQSRFLPNTAIMTGLNVVKNEQPDLNVEPVLFDPTESFKDSDVSIYQNSVFDLFEKDYEEVTGKKIKLAEGAGFKGVIDLDNEKENYNLNVYKKIVNDIASGNASWAGSLTKSQKNQFTEEWGKTIYGMIGYMKNQLPDVNTSEGEEMRKRFNNVIDNAYENFIIPMVNEDARQVVAKNRVDSVGGLKDRMIGTFNVALGGAAQAQSDLLARISSPFTGDDVEDVADQIFKYGQLKEEEGIEQLQDAEPATGRYSMTIGERWEEADGPFAKLGAVVDPRSIQMAVTENLGTQIGTTGLGIAGGVISMSPYVRAASFIGRAAMTVTAMSPSVLASYALESGDAYISARDELRTLRDNAKADKKSRNKEEFERLYSLNYSGKNITMDEMTDDMINDMSKSIANTYGAMATGIETLASSLQAGNLMRAASKTFKKDLASKVGARRFNRILANKMVKTAFAGGKFARTTVASEAIEEALQEYVQETLLSKNLPQYKKDYGAVASAAYAGGASGLLLGGSFQLAKQAGNIQQKRRIKAAEILEKKEVNDVLLTDMYDPAIVSAQLGLEPNVDNVISSLNISKDAYLAKNKTPFIRNKIEELRTNPPLFKKYIKENQNAIRDYLTLDEESLSQTGIFTARDIEQILELEKGSVKDQDVAKFKKFTGRKVTNKQIQDSDSIQAAKEGIAAEYAEYAETNLDYEGYLTDYNDDYNDPYSFEENLLNEEQDVNELLFLQKRLEELEGGTQSQTGLNPSEQKQAINRIKKEINSLQKDIKKTPKVKLTNNSKIVSAKSASKIFAKVKHIGKNNFNKEELAKIDQLKKSTTPELLNEVSKIVNSRVSNIKKELEKKYNIRKGQKVFTSNDIKTKALRNKEVIILSLNPKDVFVKGVKTGNTINIPYNFLSTKREAPKPKVKKIPLSKRKVPELKKLASQLEIPGRSKLTTRKQLVDALEKYKKDRQQQSEQSEDKKNYDNTFFDEPNELVQLQQNDPNNPTDFRATISGEKIELTPEQKEQLIKITKLMKSPVSLLKGSGSGSLFEFKRKLLNEYRGFERKVTGETVPLKDKKPARVETKQQREAREFIDEMDDFAMQFSGPNELGEKLLQAKLKKEKKPLKKASRNVRKNIVSKFVKDNLGSVQVYSEEVLRSMSYDQLQDHAKSLGINLDSFEAFDDNGLIEAIINKQPPVDLMGGFFAFGPIRKSNRVKLRQLFRRSWMDVLRATDQEGTTEGFTNWVNEEMAPFLPDPLKDEFLNWANTYNPETNKFAVMFNDIQNRLNKYRNRKDTNHEMLTFEEAVERSRENVMEAASQQFSQGADIVAENINNLNSKFFFEMQSVVDNETMDLITDNAKELSYDEWIKEISKPAYGLTNQQGETAFDIINKNRPTARRLRQYWVSQRPENNIKINDGFRDELKGETSKTKRVNLETLYTSKDGTFGPLKIKKNQENRRTLPSNSRTTMAEKFIDYDYVMLNGSDIKVKKYLKDSSGQFIINNNGRAAYRVGSKYKFLDAEQLSNLVSTQLSKSNYVPIFVRGDSDKLGLVKIKEQDTQDAVNYELYWQDELEAENNDSALSSLVSAYIGENKTDEEMSTLYKSPLSYRAANIARHKAYKAMLGNDYYKLGAHTIMHRMKILMTPAITFTGGTPVKMRMINLDKALDPDIKKPLYTVTTMKDGTKRRKNLIKMMDGQLQYVGDGQTIVSESLFDTYNQEVGTRRSAKRAKTVIVVKDENGLLLVKHQEMSQPLDTNEDKIELYYGDKKVVEFKRDNGGRVEIYTDRNGDQQFTQKIQKFLTTDEAKVATGPYANYDEVFTLPSESTGHVQFVEGDKQNASFPSQIGNYMEDDNFNKEVNKLIDTNNNSASATNLLDMMYEISKDPEMFDKFLIGLESSNPDIMPRAITEAAKLGAGLHPGQLDFGKTLVKTKLLMESMKVKQPGTILDFRANINNDVKEGNIVLPYGHKIRRIIAGRLSEKFADTTAKDIMRMTPEDINDLLKKNPVKVQLVRNPIPSRAGYRIFNVESFKTNIGDSFLINDKEVKEVFEADHDHDQGHIALLPPLLEQVMIKNQVTYPGLNLESRAGNVNDTNLGSLEDTIKLMGELQDGKFSIGEIANVSRIAGMGQSVFGEMVIDGKTVKMRSLDSEVEDKDMGEKHELQQMFRLYSQASFDNVKLRMLRKWNYSQEKLYKMLFYNSDGSPITDRQYDILNETFIKTLKKTQHIKNGSSFGNSTNISDMLKSSEEYFEFTQNRENFLREELKKYSVRLGSDEFYADKLNDLYEGKLPFFYVNDIKMKKQLHPNEKIAILPAEKIPDGITSESFLTPSYQQTKYAHYVATKFAAQDIRSSKLTAEAFAKDINKDNIDLDNLTKAEKQVFGQEIDEGFRWGKQMRGSMNDEYAKLEQNEDGSQSGYLANSSSWDYNQDFVNWTENYMSGTDKIKGYNQLSETAKVASTYAFLQGVYNVETGKSQLNARKMPPHSESENDTLLHPKVMKAYYKKYNEVLQKEPGKIPNAAIDSFAQIIKRKVGCE